MIYYLKASDFAHIVIFLLFKISLFYKFYQEDNNIILLDKCFIFHVHLCLTIP